MKLLQALQENGAVTLLKNLNRKKEVLRLYFAERLSVRGKASSGYQHVDVVMERHGASERVQNHLDSGNDLMLLHGEFHHCPVYRAEQMIQKKLLVLEDKAVQLMRHGKDDMIIRDSFNQLGQAFTLPAELAEKSANSEQ